MSSDPLECPTMEVLLLRLRNFSDERALDTEAPDSAASWARDCGTLAAQALHRAAVMELERKPRLAGLRDRIMDAEGLKATPAEAKARELPEYIAYAKEAEGYATMGQHFAAHRDYYRQRADLLIRWGGSAEAPDHFDSEEN